MQLNKLRDNPGATKARTRVGRGPGSGKGKTAGRGMKGQKSRSGVSIKGFEGGQMPIYRRLPKRGFNVLNPKEYAVINVGTLQAAIDAGRVDAAQPVTGEALEAAGLVRSRRDGVRLLGHGELKAKIEIAVDHASKSAAAAVEKSGGTLTILEEKNNAPAKANKKAPVSKNTSKEASE